MDTTRRASVYVHFPWCLAKCPYCDFVSYAAPRESIDHVGYADAVIREVDARAASAERARGGERGEGAVDGMILGSIFFGGGTPSLWEPRELGRVLARIRARFTCAEDLEVTVECNPTSLDRDRATALLDAGVGRLSIGTQALRKEQLEFLGRLHDPAGARAAIEGALASGMPRVSTDMIFGMPGQSPEDAREQAIALAEMGLSHLSCYQLTIEPGTVFGDRARRGRLPMADDGLVAEAFLAIDEGLGARGLGHYEISNYAKPGEEARHNLGYWRGEEYVGLGCAAYGMLRSGSTGGVRYRNTADPKRYVDATRELGSGGTKPTLAAVTISEEPLDAEALLRERIMLGLRIAEGIDLGKHGRDLGIDPWTPERTREVERLTSRGRLARSGDRLRIPREAWLWTDDTAARLF